MNPSFPLYIVSKGRADNARTAWTLEYMKVPYFIIIEEQEFTEYAAVIPREKILVLDKAYQRDYDTCDSLGDSKSKGPGPARNFAWDHSLVSGSEWHWVLDDNITYFFRFNRNLKVPVSDGTIFRCMEDFSLRYKNVAMAGPQYFMFAARKRKCPPFVTNTRIYSCNLIRNDVRFRWRGRYNEDTDLSLRILKSGLCTILFNAFLQGKAATQTVPGGNTEAFYKKEGTFEKSKMQIQLHPDISKLVYRYGRVHHHVDYRPFRKNRLIKKDSSEVPASVNNYGLTLRTVEKNDGFNRKRGVN